MTLALDAAVLFLLASCPALWWAFSLRAERNAAREQTARAIAVACYWRQVADGWEAVARRRPELASGVAELDQAVTAHALRLAEREPEDRRGLV